jgi:hypothetical protein
MSYPTIGNFINDYKPSFLPIYTTINNETNKKQVEGLPKGYTDFNYNKSKDHFKKCKEKDMKYNQLFIIIIKP